MAAEAGSKGRPDGRYPDSGRTKLPKLQFPFPPPDFDPLSVSFAELAKYGLPQRPDQQTQPDLLRAWLRLFERPLIFTQPDSVKLEFHPPKPEIRLTIPSLTRVQDSANWCGAYIVPNGGQQFVLVSGEWTVPKPELPPPPEQGPSGQSNDYHCSTWIGLDGNRRYLNSSLPQIGTEQILTVDPNGNQTYQYTAWFEWWALSEVTLTKFILQGMTIDAGVSVMAMIWAIDPHHVVALLRTYAPYNQITVLVEQTPQVWLTPAHVSQAQPAISGATAEWIHERPLHNGVLTRFAKYNPVRFCHCVAGTAPTAGLATGQENIVSPRLCRLFEVPTAERPRLRLISMPTHISDTSVEVRYGGFT